MAGNWIGVSCGLVLPCTDEAGAGPTKCKHRDIQLSDTPADLSALTFVPQLVEFVYPRIRAKSFTCCPQIDSGPSCFWSQLRHKHPHRSIVCTQPIRARYRLSKFLILSCGVEEDGRLRQILFRVSE